MGKVTISTVLGYKEYVVENIKNIRGEDEENSDFRIYPDYHKIYRGQTEIVLTKAEYELFMLLSGRPGVIFTKEKIFEILYNEELPESIDNIVYCLVSSMRKKIEPELKQCRYIKTVRGFLEEKGVRVMVLELPTTLFDLSQMENNLAKMMIETINNMMIELYASMAQAEMEKKEKRQKEGMEAKRLRGEWDEVGRPRAIEQEKFNQNLKMRNSTMEYKVNQAYEELKRLIQWNPNSEEKFLQKMVCLLLPGQRKCWPEAIRDLRQSFEAEQWMIFVEKYRGKLEWLNSISLAELQRKIGEIFFVDHYKMIADQFLYKKDFETSLFLRIAMETGIRSADIPCIEWSCMHGKTIILEETKRGDLYKKVNGTFPKISTQSLRIMKLLHRKQGKIFTKSNEYYVRKISCAWGMPGFRIHSFRDYRRKIEMGITAGVQVPRIIPL